MTVNFTGIKNIGYMKIQNQFTNTENDVLSFQVTNDRSGNDLDEFKNAIKKMDTKENYINPINTGLITIASCKQNKEGEFETPDYEFFLNSKKLPINDSSLPMFTYLAKVTKNIEAKKKDDFIVNKDYLESEDFLRGTGVGYAMNFVAKADSSINLKQAVEYLHSPGAAHIGAETVNNSIQEAMMDYLG